MASFLASTLTNLFGSVAAATSSYRGWGDTRIRWMSFSEGFEKAQEDDRPIMVIVEQERCGGCRTLGLMFDTSDELQDLSKEFVMVHVTTTDETLPKGYDNGFLPGRRFFPRILFYSSQGKPIKDVKGDEKFLYSYTAEEDIIDSMFMVATINKQTHLKNLKSPSKNKGRSWKVTKSGLRFE